VPRRSCISRTGILRGTCLLKDNAISARYAKASAELGSIRAAVVLGQVYMQGLGVPQDRAEAERWLTKAVDAGDAEGALLLAQFYLMDPRTQARALPLAQQAADRQMPGAYAVLGVMYGSGAGVAADYGASRRWLERAVEAGRNEPAVNVALSWAALAPGRLRSHPQGPPKRAGGRHRGSAPRRSTAPTLLLNGQLGNAASSTSPPGLLLGDTNTCAPCAGFRLPARRRGTTRPCGAIEQHSASRRRRAAGK